MKMKNKRMHSIAKNAMRLALEIFLEEDPHRCKVLLERYKNRKYPPIEKVWEELKKLSVLPVKVEV
jgi:hypothetical protein